MTARVAGSFRDPAGFVFTRDGVLYRQVNRSFRERYDAVVASGLFEALIAQGLLVAHSEVDVEPADPAAASLVLRPERVPFVSYPFEWSPGQLQAAAQVTLDAQRLALEHGMSLRDASAYNVQFLRGRPVLIDTLSFEPQPEGRPWVAYAQFCQHFLAPLALMNHVDVRLGQLLRVHLDGIPLDLAAALLPGRTRVQAGLAMHIHAHAASQRRHAGDSAAEGASAAQRTVSRNAMVGLLNSLGNAVSKQQWDPPPSAWRDYYAAKESYSDDALAHKEELVAEAVAAAAPATVWDLGGNTGRFSRIAAKAGADVVTLEMDPSAVELNWREVVSGSETTVLPLVCDLSNPTPSQGWAHNERPSITERGPADMALALALVHHIAIGNNVPLPSIAEWFSRLGRRLVIEWIPKEDPMVQRLLASREDIFDDYHQAGFEAAIEPFFSVVERASVRASARTIYVLDSRAK